MHRSFFEGVENWLLHTQNRKYYVNQSISATLANFSYETGFFFLAEFPFSLLLFSFCQFFAMHFNFLPQKFYALLLFRLHFACCLPLLSFRLVTLKFFFSHGNSIWPQIELRSKVSALKLRSRNVCYGAMDLTFDSECVVVECLMHS